MRKNALTARFILLMLIVVLPLGVVNAGEIVAVRLELLSPDSLHLQLDEVVDSPIQVRVLRQSDSQPLEGVLVSFFSDVRLCVPMDPACVEPNPSLYGGFLSAPNEPPGYVQVSSGADGIAVSPDFQAGSVAGSYRIVAAVYSVVGQNYSSSTGNPVTAVQVLQGGNAGGATAVVPSSAWQGRAMLIGLVLLLGGLTLRRMHG
jgi:hypothetical protein